MLGSLAKKLRMLGIDTAYLSDAPDAQLKYVVRSEGRILLTRDASLAKQLGEKAGIAGLRFATRATLHVPGARCTAIGTYADKWSATARTLRRVEFIEMIAFRTSLLRCHRTPESWRSPSWTQHMDQASHPADGNLQEKLTPGSSKEASPNT